MNSAANPVPVGHFDIFFVVMVILVSTSAESSQLWHDAYEDEWVHGGVTVLQYYSPVIQHVEQNSLRLLPSRFIVSPGNFPAKT